VFCDVEQLSSVKEIRKEMNTVLVNIAGYNIFVLDRLGWWHGLLFTTSCFTYKLPLLFTILASMYSLMQRWCVCQITDNIIVDIGGCPKCVNLIDSAVL